MLRRLQESKRAQAETVGELARDGSPGLVAPPYAGLNFAPVIIALELLGLRAIEGSLDSLVRGHSVLFPLRVVWSLLAVASRLAAETIMPSAKKCRLCLMAVIKLP